jgi:hypothetical protein
MNANETWAERIRLLCAHELLVRERSMFGGLGFVINGNMICGVTGRDELVMHLGAEGERLARRLPGAGDMDFSRRMGNMVFVSPQAVADDAMLGRWLQLALDHAATLPPLQGEPD